MAHNSTHPAPTCPHGPSLQEWYSVPSLRVNTLLGWQFCGTRWDQQQVSFQNLSQRHPRIHPSPTS